MRVGADEQPTAHHPAQDPSNAVPPQRSTAQHTTRPHCAATQVLGSQLAATPATRCCLRGASHSTPQHSTARPQSHLVAESDEIINGQGPSKALPQQHLMAAYVSRQAPVTIHVCAAAGHDRGFCVIGRADTGSTRQYPSTPNYQSSNWHPTNQSPNQRIRSYQSPT